MQFDLRIALQAWSCASSGDMAMVLQSGAGGRPVLLLHVDAGREV